MIYNPIQKAQLLITYIIEKASTLQIAVDCFNSISTKIKQRNCEELYDEADKYLE